MPQMNFDEEALGRQIGLRIKASEERADKMVASLVEDLSSREAEQADINIARLELARAISTKLPMDAVAGLVAELTYRLALVEINTPPVTEGPEATRAWMRQMSDEANQDTVKTERVEGFGLRTDQK